MRAVVTVESDTLFTLQYLETQEQKDPHTRQFQNGHSLTLVSDQQVVDLAQVKK